MDGFLFHSLLCVVSIGLYACFCHKMTFYQLGGYDHSVSYTTAQLTEGRSARDQPKQPPAKKNHNILSTPRQKKHKVIFIILVLLASLHERTSWFVSCKDLKLLASQSTKVQIEEKRYIWIGQTYCASLMYTLFVLVFQITCWHISTQPC